MGKSNIEWTEATWNPVRGCSIVSEGCRNCYAMRMAHRSNRSGGAYEGLTRIGAHGPTWTGDVRFVPELLEYPLRLRKPHRIFVNSMSDLFHESLSDGVILSIFDVMRRCPQHTFQILTKRPGRMLDWFRRWADTSGEPLDPQMVRGPEETRATHPSPRGQMFASYLETLGSEPPPGCAWPTFDWMDGMRWWPDSAFTLPNIWLGVSCEDQKTADARIPVLLETPAAVRWISAEPLLGPVRIEDFIWPTCWHWAAGYKSPQEALAAGAYAEKRPQGLVHADCRFLNWVVVGGESGPGARPTHPDWIRSLRDQCAAARVPFFFKQWGAFMPVDTPSPFYTLGEFGDPQYYDRVGKKAAGAILDGRAWKEYPKAA